MSANRLDIVTCGWELPGWEREFYPADLPADWRLTFFANEFPAVMVASERWAGVGEASLRDWSDDVPEGFRFYLEDPGAVADPSYLRLARRALGVKLAGLVSEVAVGAVASPCVRPVVCFQILRDSDGVPKGGCLPAWRIPRAHVRDLRAGRVWLESLGTGVPSGRGLLVLAGEDIGIEDLRRWRHLVLLTGVA